MKDHLKKNLAQQKLIKLYIFFIYIYMKKIRYKWSYQIKGKTNTQLDIFYHRMKLPVLGMTCIQTRRWLKDPNGNPQTAQVIDKTLSDSPQTDDKVLLLKITPMQLIKHKEV